MSRTLDALPARRRPAAKAVPLSDGLASYAVSALMLSGALVGVLAISCLLSLARLL